MEPYTPDSVPGASLTRSHEAGVGECRSERLLDA